MGLPFVLVHGALLWKLSLVAVTGGAVAGISLLRRRRARRAVRREVAQLDARNDPGLVRGTLGGGDAVSVAARVDFESTATADHRGEDLWIETAEGRIALEGPLRVVAGSHAAAARNGVPREAPDALVAGNPTMHRKQATWRAKITTATLARVVPGDEVVALGQLETVAGDRETDARTNAARRVLRPIGDAPIAIAARTPRGAAPRMPIAGLVLLVGLVSVVGWRIEVALGDHWHDACWDHGVEELPAAPLLLSNTHVCVLAAAMPGSRDHVLTELEAITERSAYHDRAMFEQRLAIGKLTGECDPVVDLLRTAERYDEMVGVAHECGDRRAEHNALVELGRFDEAVAVPVNAEGDSKAALPTTATLILAGKWNAAAASADRHAAEVRNRKHDADEERSVVLTALSYECLAELLRHHGGDAGALGRLRTLAAGPDGGVCAPELAEVVPEAERAAVLARDDDHLIPSELLLGRMRAFGGGKGTFESTSAESVLAQPDEFGPARAGATIWLAATMPVSTEAPAGQRALVERWQVVAATLGGDYAAARELAAHAIADAEHADDMDRYELRNTKLLPALIALYAGGDVTYAVPTEPSYRELWFQEFGRLLLRHGDPLDKEAYFGPDSKYVAALEQAEHGDGTALAQRMGSRSAWWSDADILAVLPRITVGRDAVVRELEWSTPHDALRIDFNFPWSAALHAAARRASLQAAGATDAAARWREIYERYDRALHDRKKLVALALWEL